MVIDSSMHPGYACAPRFRGTCKHSIGLMMEHYGYKFALGRQFSVNLLWHKYNFTCHIKLYRRIIIKSIQFSLLLKLNILTKSNKNYIVYICEIKSV